MSFKMIIPYKRQRKGKDINMLQYSQVYFEKIARLQKNCIDSQLAIVSRRQNNKEEQYSVSTISKLELSIVSKPSCFQTADSKLHEPDKLDTSEHVGDRNFRTLAHQQVAQKVLFPL